MAKGPVIIYDRRGGGGSEVEMIFVENFFEAHSRFSRYFSGPTRTNRKNSGPTQKSHHFMHENLIIYPFFLLLNFHSQIFFRAHYLDFKIFSGPTPLNLNIFQGPPTSDSRPPPVINNDRSLIESSIHF